MCEMNIVARQKVVMYGLTMRRGKNVEERYRAYKGKTSSYAESVGQHVGTTEGMRGRAIGGSIEEYPGAHGRFACTMSCLFRLVDC